MHLRNVVLGILVVAFGAGCALQGSDTKSAPATLQSQDGIGSSTRAAGGGTLVDVLPDFRPMWASYSMQDIRITTANPSDRIVSCDDWTQIDLTPITGQRVLSFTLGSPNFGRGHLRIRSQVQSDGNHMVQVTSQMDQDTGECFSDPTGTEIAVIPNGQSGRFLPLARFALWTEAEDGGIGDLAVCQIKRWCCLVNTPTCDTNPPCPLATLNHNLNAGSRDVYPFHFQDQFIPIDGLKSGNYWVEDTINPGNIMIESDYENNSMLFKIQLDQEARTVTILEPPDPSFSMCPM